MDKVPGYLYHVKQGIKTFIEITVQYVKPSPRLQHETIFYTELLIVLGHKDCSVVIILNGYDALPSLLCLAIV